MQEKIDQTQRYSPWQFSLQPIAANSILIVFNDVSSPTNNKENLALPANPTPELCDYIHQCRETIATSFKGTIQDIVSAYNSIVVHFDVRQIDHARLIASLEKIIASIDPHSAQQLKQKRDLHIPVYYADESGPDLARIATTNNISIEDIIQTHCNQNYTAYAVGFAPGFAYLGFVSPAIKMARLSSPRKHVLKGSVAIADQQTAIYPSDSPGGWNIIGRTPSPMLIEENHQIKSYIQSGDTVSFYPISRDEFLQLGGEL